MPTLLRAADEARVIYPGAAATPAAPVAAGAASPVLTLLGVLALAGAGAWVFWKSRAGGPAGFKAGRLAVSETKSLGNRQFLVVASYDDRKFLLGVCPGRIELLAPLSDAPAPAPKFSA